MPVRLEDLLKQDTPAEESNDSYTALRFPSDDDYFNEDLIVPERPIEIPDYLLNDPEIVGYPDLEMQEEIYEWVKESLPIHNYSVKDFGCGRGDIFNVLTKNLFDDVVGVEYFGIDNRISMIESGESKYLHLQCHFINNDFLEVDLQTDYTLIVGTLNDKHIYDKWDYFNRTLNHALLNTKEAIIFVLSANNDEVDSQLDYPLHELFQKLSTNLPIKIDYSRFKDIYKLTVHIGSFN